MKRKILLLICFFFLFIESSFGASFIEEMNQPHLKVVSYNEVLESIKNNVLSPVSIFSDEELKIKWSNTLVSLGIIIILVFLIKIGISIIYGSKNNLKRDWAFLLLLFFIASMFTPFFSLISDLTSGEEKFYSDPVTEEQYARVYLPANTAIKVLPSYINEKWEKIGYESYLKKRNSVFEENSFNYSHDYLGVPAKVVQTQLESESDPESRYSTAFYSVNLDTLFNDMVWPTKNIGSCSLRVDTLLEQWDWAAFNIIGALGRDDWQRKYEEKKEAFFEDKYQPYSDIDGSKIEWKGVVVEEKDCTLWEYFLSEDFIESFSYGLANNAGTAFLETKTLAALREEQWDRESLQNLLLSSGWAVMYTSKTMKDLWPSLSYEQQKRVIYTLEAAKNLFIMSRFDNKDIKQDIGVAEAMKACGRILSDEIQSNEDFRICLHGDVAGDTTMYTFETTKNIGLAGTNPEVNEGYVLPVPQNEDWDHPAYYRVGNDLLSFLNISNYKDDDGWFFSFLFWNWGKDTEAEQYGVYQSIITESPRVYSRQQFQPQLASFNTYDIDGNGEVDRDQWAVGGKDPLDEKFHSYFYGDVTDIEDINLKTDSLDYLKSPLYKTIPNEDSDEEIGFIALWENANIVPVDEDDVDKTSVSTYSVESITDQDYIFISSERKNIVDSGLRAWDYIPDTIATLGHEMYSFDPQTKSSSSINAVAKLSGKSYTYFTTPSFESLFYTNSDFIEPVRMMEWEIEETGYFISNTESSNISASSKTTNGSLLQGEYIFQGITGFNHCENVAEMKAHLSGTLCKTVTRIDGLLLDSYISQAISQEKEVYTIFKRGSSYYVENQIELSNTPKLSDLYIAPGTFSYSSAANIYFYKNLATSTIVAFDPGTHYQNYQRFFSSTVSPANISYITQKGSASVERYDGNIGYTIDISTPSVDFDILWKEYPSRFSRVLLNPQYNPPLEYIPNNEFYLPEYQNNDGVCVINKEYWEKYKNFFDYYPGKSEDFLDKCSLIGNHNRISDVRLNTLVQSESLINISPESESFTHIHIPLTTNAYIKTFSEDRRDYSYAGEALKEDGLLWTKRVTGLKITEGDIAVLKPWVVLWAYNYPFTLIVSSDIVPFLEYVKTDNPLEKTHSSKIYSGGIFSIVSGLIKFVREGEASQALLWNATSLTEEEKYENFVADKYDSRPEALKKIEWVVPDRFFSAYYGSAYFSNSESGRLNTTFTSIAELGLNLVDIILSYRVEFLKFIYILGPLLVFTLLFQATRKIFSFVITITIILLLLPIIILVLVNLFA